MTVGTPYEGRLWLVGGCVRDALLGLTVGEDLDIVLETSAHELAEFLYHSGITQATPAEFEKFGTAMVTVQGCQIEMVQARRESYQEDSRKPDVEPATLQEDALRRDFTLNTLMLNLHTDELLDSTGQGVSDLQAKVLRTPRDPDQTFFDDPLRMLRAVRFKNRFGFMFAAGLAEALKRNANRLQVISAERIREEFSKMIVHPTASDALRDLNEAQLLHQFAPELVAMQGVTQGKWHHADVWDHTLEVVRQAGSGDLELALAALLHDVGKPATRSVDANGDIRFFGHESVGAEMARKLLRRLRYPGETIERVSLLVASHMRLGGAPNFSPAAYRRLVRDMGDELEHLLQLVEADQNSLKTGLKITDLAQIRQTLSQVQIQTPRSSLVSPLTGQEIMELLSIGPGPQIGEIKSLLEEAIIEGRLAPGDKVAAKQLLLPPPEAQEEVGEPHEPGGDCHSA